MLGFVKVCARSDGYCLLETENRKTAYLSSYEMDRKEWKKLSFGSIVEFDHVVNGRRNIATNCKLVERYPGDNKVIYLTKKRYAPVRHIKRLYVQYGENAIRDIHVSVDDVYRHGYRVSDFDNLFIEYARGEKEQFFKRGAPVEGNGQIDVKVKFDEIYCSYRNALKKYVNERSS